MRSLHAVLALMPGTVRGKVMSALLLMAVFPALGATLVVSDCFRGRIYGAATICTVLGLCLALSCLGFWQIRALVLSVVDIKEFVGQVLALQTGKCDGRMTDTEISKIERLIIYLQDQIEAAQRVIEAYFSACDRTHLPPVVRCVMLDTRMKAELGRAEADHTQAGVISWLSVHDARTDPADEGAVPGWLGALLRDTGGAFRFVGRIQPGHWVGLLDQRNSPRIADIAAHYQTFARSLPGKAFVVRTWRHPLDRFDFVEEMARGALNLAQAGPDSRKAVNACARPAGHTLPDRSDG